MILAFETFYNLSESYFLTAFLTIESPIKEINCPKTDLVEKYLFLPIVVFVLQLKTTIILRSH